MRMCVDMLIYIFILFHVHVHVYVYFIYLLETTKLDRRVSVFKRQYLYPYDLYIYLLWKLVCAKIWLLKTRSSEASTFICAVNTIFTSSKWNYWINCPFWGKYRQATSTETETSTVICENNGWTTNSYRGRMAGFYCQLDPLNI